MTLPAWTYSGLDTFATCPRKYYHLKVVRDTVDPPNEHTEWGTRVHDALERRIKDGTPLPEGMTQWEPLMKKIDAWPGDKLTEHKFAVDRNFQPAPWDNAWSRGIADLVVIHNDTAVVIDYKTGKRKPTEQLELYTAYVFAHFPKLQTCGNSLVWLKERKVDKTTINREDAQRDVVTKFQSKASRLESAHERGSWPARPSGLCKRWCPVTSCEFNGMRASK
jgi:CRISPR/Cas system-associated exonuclease Cas4 (RecB family)